MPRNDDFLIERLPYKALRRPPYMGKRKEAEEKIIIKIKKNKNLIPHPLKMCLLIKALYNTYYIHW